MANRSIIPNRFAPRSIADVDSQLTLHPLRGDDLPTVPRQWISDVHFYDPYLIKANQDRNLPARRLVQAFDLARRTVGQVAAISDTNVGQVAVYDRGDTDRTEVRMLTIPHGNFMRSLLDLRPMLSIVSFDEQVPTEPDAAQELLRELVAEAVYQAINVPGERR
ncbi:MAG: hypothetical protein JWN38_366 [Candidatus Saccharibacteria bacterium]|nr:hypothetical protein [Candidatus Saccharibacteria bacterium]